MATRTLPARRPLPAADAVRGDEGVAQLARWLESAFSVPGTNIRFGLDALVGLLPGAGDLLTALAAIYILNAAHRRGVSRATLLRMGLNIGFDVLLGAVPLVGDLFDVYFKANQRNAALLQQHLAAAPAEARRLRRGDRWFVGAIVAAVLAVLAATMYTAIRLAAWLASVLLG